jgi:hypothetical protein
MLVGRDIETISAALIGAGVTSNPVPGQATRIPW